MPVFEEYRAGGGLHRQADLRRQTGRADLHVPLVAGKRLAHQCLGTGTSAYIADADDQYPFEHFIGFQSCGAGAWNLSVDRLCRCPEYSERTCHQRGFRNFLKQVRRQNCKLLHGCDRFVLFGYATAPGFGVGLLKTSTWPFRDVRTAVHRLVQACVRYFDHGHRRNSCSALNPPCEQQQGTSWITFIFIILLWLFLFVV